MVAFGNLSQIAALVFSLVALAFTLLGVSRDDARLAQSGSRALLATAAFTTLAFMCGYPLALAQPQQQLLAAPLPSPAR